MATEKQKLTVKYMAEGMNRYRAMLKAGYSDSYAKRSEIKHLKGWQELMDKYLPEDKIVKALDYLIDHTDIKEKRFSMDLKKDEVEGVMKDLGYNKSNYVIVPDKEIKNVSGDVVEIPYWKVLMKVRDPNAISNGTEKAIKMRGRYAPDQLEVKMDKWDDLSDEELNKRIVELEQQLNQSKKD
jgi:hypothetical protein